MGRKKLDIPLRDCVVCGIQIPRNTTSIGKRIPAKQYIKTNFCSRKCKGVEHGKLISGDKNYNYKGGKSKCVDCNKQLSQRYSVPKRCRPCSVIAKTTGINYPLCLNCSSKTGDHKSILCRNCARGALHHAWKGGVSSIQALIRTMPENRKWQKQCMYRDNWECVKCGVNKKLEVHHIKSFATILKEHNITTKSSAIICNELWDINNGMTLCRKCHKLTDSYSKKIN